MCGYAWLRLARPWQQRAAPVALQLPPAQRLQDQPLQLRKCHDGSEPGCRDATLRGSRHGQNECELHKVRVEIRVHHEAHLLEVVNLGPTHTRTHPRQTEREEALVLLMWGNEIPKPLNPKPLNPKPNPPPPPSPLAFQAPCWGSPKLGAGS